MRSLHGNTHGLKPNQLRRIEKLYTRRIPPHEIVTPEFARQLSELSHETNRQIGALIDRKGYVEYVVVGDARRIELPDFKRVRVAGDRFRGLRFVHTHLRGEELTRDDLTDLALLRLDLMAAIEVDARRAGSVAEMVAVNDRFVEVEVLLDLTGRERFVFARRA